MPSQRPSNGAADVWNLSHFDEKAKTWDEEPRRVALASAIARMIAGKLNATQRPRLMDYGCGTGLCSLPLAGRCVSVLGLDCSAGMLEQFEAKARAAGFGHVSARHHDLVAESLDGFEFDVILCAMTLHHVREVKALLNRFHSMLAPCGLLALADLDAEDGSFHQDMSGVEHHGFHREWMAAQLRATGFGKPVFETVYEIEKPDASGTLRRYPVFLATAKKSQ
ncbi:MAG: class I SAM-dependent methyltransferase [Verrucomicrobia bacterium]|nr:class I SAM-dependent methyltransferase [Verrucomicrobiota bacterium]